MYQLSETEIYIMDLIWNREGEYALNISKIMMEERGWKKNTTYSILKRMIDKGVIEKINPKFFCKPLITKEEVITHEANSLINKICGGSKKIFFASFLNNENLSENEINELKNIIEKNSR